MSQRHEEVYHAMRKRGIGFRIEVEYDTPEIFVGAAIRLSDVPKLAEIPGIHAIRPIVKVPAPKPVSSSVVKDVSDPTVPDSFSTHVMTGVDKVHAQGNFGQGIKIGIIDTGTLFSVVVCGVDYNHPLLGGGFGPGFKISGGYDFVGDDYNGENLPKPDGNPLDECNGHGTHVTGIIGASPNNTLGIGGVASSSSLSMYRIFGCTGYTTDDIIVSALIMGYNEKMDVLTMSVGGPSGFTEGTASVVSSRIAAQGRVVTAAAGNNGVLGAWYTSDPGGGIGAISVASVDNIVSPVQNATVHGVDHPPIPYFMATPLDVTGEMPIYATSTNISQTDDACQSLPDDTPDLSSYLVIVHRGTCAFTQKLMNIAAKNGQLVLIYNSDGGSFSSISVGSFQAVLISADDGKFLVNQFIAKAPITISFPQSGGAFSVPNPDGGLISTFSTMGPTNDMFLSPALAAPGGNILSTLPLALGGYALESGTSMACPFAAGAAALVLHAIGKTPEAGRAVGRILQTTAVGVASTHTDQAPLQTVAQQGAGLIQVDRAIGMKTIVSPGQIALNDTAHFKANHTISIQNLGTKSVTYLLHHEPAGTLSTVKNGYVTTAPALMHAAAHVAFSASTVTVPAGHTKRVSVVFTPPGGLINTTLPVYSGFIHVSTVSGMATPAAAETLKITYLGVAADLHATPVLDTTKRYFGIALPAMIGARSQPQVGPANYTFMGDDMPYVLYRRLVFGCTRLRVDLVPHDTQFKPTIARRDAFTWWWEPSAAGSSTTFGKIKTIGPLGEMDYLPRNTINGGTGYSSFSWSGTFANGTRVNDGQYRVLLRALKVAGNPKNEEDYESWMSPQIGVVTPEAGRT
ncbi:subtilisin-like protease [Mycena rebaudengoi]|nr:subtilisin-like protease [Mycena rebaudengoi]